MKLRKSSLYKLMELNPYYLFNTMSMTGSFVFGLESKVNNK